MLAVLKGIEESKWADVTYQMELNKGLLLVEEARSTFKKALAKVEAARWQRTVQGEGPGGFDEVADGLGVSKGLWHWFKMGLAFTAPLMVLIFLLFVIYAWTQGAWWIFSRGAPPHG